MNNKIETTNRMFYIDILKIISCFAVIFLHVSAQNFELYLPNTLEWQVFNFYDSCVRFAVPVFVMVSGALFLDKNKKTMSIKKLYTKNILRLFIAYIFYTIFYSFFNYYIENHTIDIKTIIKNALLSSNYHLWFIPMLIGIYTLIPAIKKITENSSQSEIKYMLTLFFIFNILKTTITSLEYPYSQYIAGILKRFSINMFIGFIGYFLLGYYLNTFIIQKRNRIIIYILGIINLIICIVGNSLYSLKLNKATQLFYDNFFITTFFISIAVFVFVKYSISKIKINNLASKIIINLSSASFGIYLIHIFVICLFTINFNVTAYNPIFSIPIISICVFFLSLIIINIIKKIPFINKYIT